jgi:hypothetical protein
MEMLSLPYFLIVPFRFVRPNEHYITRCFLQFGVVIV